MTEVTRNFFDPLPAAHKSKIYEVVETSTRHAQQNVDLKMAVVEREDYILALHEGLDAEVQAKEAHNDQLQEELSQVRTSIIRATHCAVASADFSCFDAAHTLRPMRKSSALSSHCSFVNRYHCTLY